MRRAQAYIQVLSATALLIVVNALAGYLPGRIDLTEEGRFTLTGATERVVGELQDPLYVEVLLEGEFPAGFRRLRASVEELLRDLERINGYVEYAFTDPNEGSIEEVNANRELLAERGINPINLEVRDADGGSTRLAYPYAILTYRNRTTVANLLENNQPGQSPEVALNNSVSLLEYKLANAVQKLLRTRRPVIAFTTGHGELREPQTRSLAQALAPYYEVGRVRLDTMGGFGPDDIGVLLVAKPLGAFSQREKFLIDQYVMRGGRVIWMLDRLAVNLDSLQRAAQFIPGDIALDLDDQLFRYGLRVEPNLVLDIQSTRIPVVTGQVGDAPQMQLRPWPYHVLANPNPDHPISRALQPVNLYFPSEIDTSVRTRTPVRKTVLLSSSDNALLRFSPVQIELESARYDFEVARFDDGPVPIGVLLEGIFPSLYENRVDSAFARELAAIGQEFRAESVPTAQIVIADGDIAKNQVDPQQNAIRPLGLNPFERYVFDNEDFLLNAIEYLLDDGGVIAARNRDVKLRLLDAPRARAEAGFWRALNLLGPLVALGLFGFGYNAWRRRRYARP